jgi:hypothetical protein
MKIWFHYYRDGHCWTFMPTFTRYWMKKLWYFNFWRFQMVWDFRRNWIKDMYNACRES